MRETQSEPASAFITEAQFCDRFGITARTAQRWRVSGEGPPWVRLGVRRIAYREADCERWAAERTYSSRAAEAADRRDAA
jgi:predicted DNA-binding transcriptional regulator AlpA